MLLGLLKSVEIIAKKAGKDILLPAFISQSSIQSIKQDGSIVTETDQQCQDFLQVELAKISSNIGFLGEEMTHEEQLTCLHRGNTSEIGRFWCVDPLDGTGNFATPMPLFAISIGLIENGKPVLACIYDPIRDEMFSAVQGGTLLLNGLPMDQIPFSKPLNQSIGFVDFKRLKSDLASDLATHKYYRSQRNLGTCALEWAWLAAGRAQFIVHGGQKLWDYAAGLLLAEAAGCIITDFEGTHPFDAAQLSCPILATSNTSLTKEWSNILAKHADG
ncbi:MAG: inositol monophosphatase family protein [Ghiorsea sp.]